MGVQVIKKQKFISALFFIGLSLTVMRIMPITVITNTPAVIGVMPMVVVQEPSVGGLLGGIIGGFIGNVLRKRAEAKQRLYEHELQLATQERLMNIAHQQKLTEMAYQQELKLQKRVISKTHATSEIGILVSLVVMFCFILLLGVVLPIRRKENS
jgi:hypothetical protein